VPPPPILRKTLQVKIVDDEEYEKKDNFFIELGQPRWLKRGISGMGGAGQGWAGGLGGQSPGAISPPSSPSLCSPAAHPR